MTGSLKLLSGITNATQLKGSNDRSALQMPLRLKITIWRIAKYMEISTFQHFISANLSFAFWIL